MKKMKAFMLAVVTVALLIVGSGATAVAAPAVTAGSYQGVDIYLKLDGVCGESTAEQYPNWIDLDSVSFGVANSATAAQGAGGAAGKASLQFNVAKMYDCSSIPLTLNAASGKHIKNGQIVYVTRSEQPFTVLTIDLTDVVISAYQFGDLNESLSLTAGAIGFTYNAMDETGASKPPVRGTWDFNKNK